MNKSFNLLQDLHQVVLTILLQFLLQLLLLLELLDYGEVLLLLELEILDMLPPLNFQLLVLRLQLLYLNQQLSIILVLTRKLTQVPIYN